MKDEGGPLILRVASGRLKALKGCLEWPYHLIQFILASVVGYYLTDIPWWLFAGLISSFTIGLSLFYCQKFKRQSNDNIAYDPETRFEFREKEGLRFVKASKVVDVAWGDIQAMGVFDFNRRRNHQILFLVLMHNGGFIALDAALPGFGGATEHFYKLFTNLTDVWFWDFMGGNFRNSSSGVIILGENEPCFQGNSLDIQSIFDRIGTAGWIECPPENGGIGLFTREWERKA